MKNHCEDTENRLEMYKIRKSAAGLPAHSKEQRGKISPSFMMNIMSMQPALGRQRIFRCNPPCPSLHLNEGRTYGQPEVVRISLPQVATGLLNSHFQKNGADRNRLITQQNISKIPLWTRGCVQIGVSMIKRMETHMCIYII